MRASSFAYLLVTSPILLEAIAVLPLHVGSTLPVVVVVSIFRWTVGSDTISAASGFAGDQVDPPALCVHDSRRRNICKE